MHQCCVFGCRNQGNHKFPREKNIRIQWEAATGYKDFTAKKHSKMCAAHFKSEDFIKVGKYSGLINTRRILKKGVVPSVFQSTKTEHITSKQWRKRAEDRRAKQISSFLRIENFDDLPPFPNSTAATNHTSFETAAFNCGVDHVEEVVTQENGEQVSPPSPGPLESDSTLTAPPQQSDLDTFDFNEVKDPLGLQIDDIVLCRCCGEFNTDCLDVTVEEKPYLSSYRTTLTLNGLGVDLDFNNHTLPKTVCRDCDRKLQEIYDFVKLVKTTQVTLNHPGDDDMKDKFKTVVVKTECVSPTNDDSDYINNDDTNDSKDVIRDILPIKKILFVKKAVLTHKRKNNDVVKIKKQAKPKVYKAVRCEDTELVVDISKGIVDEESSNPHRAYSEFSDTGTDINSSDFVTMTYKLMNEIAGDDTLS